MDYCYGGTASGVTRDEDADLIVAAVNALPALLDAADERDELAGVESRLSALLWDLTGGKLSKTSYPVAFMVQEIEEHLAQYYESDAADERDRLAATIERVRELHRAVGIYDPCECTDDEKKTGHKDVEEVGLTCNKLYDICAECCRDDVYQTETCAAYHDHKPGEAHCRKTMEALAHDDSLVYHKDMIEGETMKHEVTVTDAMVEKALRFSDAEMLDQIKSKAGMTGVRERMMRAALEAVAPTIAAQALRDALARLGRAAAYEVDSTHHFHGIQCSCGFTGDARKRTQTEHITTAVLDAYNRMTDQIAGDDS